MRRPVRLVGRQGAMLALVGLLTIVGCTGPSAGVAPTPAPRVDGQPEPRQPQGTLRMSFGVEPNNLSPKFGTAGGGSFNSLATTFNAFLTYYDLGGGIHP